MPSLLKTCSATDAKCERAGVIFTSRHEGKGERRERKRKRRRKRGKRQKRGGGREGEKGGKRRSKGKKTEGEKRYSKTIGEGREWKGDETEGRGKKENEPQYL